MVIAYPREFGKSTFAWELLASWNVLHARYSYILFIASTVDKAEKNLSINVVPNILNHPLLKGQIEVLKNTKSEFHYKNKTTGTMHFVACYGAGQNLRGARFDRYRPDFVIIDDIEDTEKVRSADQRVKLKDWFYADVMPLGKEARFFFVGTMLHQDCLLANLMEEPPMDLALNTPWEVRRYGVTDALGKSTWPEKYSEDWIDAKRKEFIRAGMLDRFNTEYMNIPVSRADRKFLPEQVKFYAPDQLEAAQKGGFDILITVDPGISNEANRDPTVIAVTAKDKNGNMWIIDMIRKRMRQNAILDEIVRIYRLYRPRMTFIESVQAQIWLYQSLCDGSHESRDIIPCEKIDGSQVRMGKVVRIEALDEPFSRKNILVPADCGWWPDLCNEMVTFPKGKHDDMLDTLSYAWLNHITPGGCNFNLQDMLASARSSSTVF
jgi:predicted phage terminase large subunit-like protein